ncbi:hypothetical protein [Pseudokineococcus sp. 1T1Z-3]|uniref:hypothetical protein n=1 Tax=Pseudokineococcus sp. 1T1Z-3 TaxID=3132745 RepID=UPI0030B61AD5
MSEGRQPGERPAPTAEELAGAERVDLRRRPRYTVLIVLGALVGVVVAAGLTATAQDNDTYSAAAVFGYLAAGLALVGGLLGGLVGVLLERVARRR